MLALLVAAGVVAGVNYTMKSSSTSSGYAAFFVQLTDPPELPQGTTSLVIQYSSVGVHTEGGWITASTSGTVNLTDLTNVSETIASFKVPVGSVVNAVRFEIASAVITVNKTLYNVTVPSNQLQVAVNGAAKLGGTSATLVSLNTKVFEITLGNGSKPVFILVPSATAILVPPGQVNSKAEKLGAKAPVGKQEDQEISDIRASIRVEAGLGVSTHGQTELIVNITNNGSIPVTLAGVSLHGPFNVSISVPQASCTSSKQGEEGSNNDTGHQGGNGTQNTGEGQDSQQNDAQPCGNTQMEHEFEHPDEVVFLTNASACVAVPASTVSSSTTSTTSSTSTISTSSSSTTSSSTTSTTTSTPTSFKCTLVTAGKGDQGNDNAQGNEDSQGNNVTPIIIQPGQTYLLTYGPANITYGDSHVTVSAISGANYSLHIIASNNAEMKCLVQASSTIPPTLKACTPLRGDLGDNGNGNGNGQDDFVAIGALANLVEKLFSSL